MIATLPYVNEYLTSTKLPNNPKQEDPNGYRMFEDNLINSWNFSSYRAEMRASLPSRFKIS